MASLTPYEQRFFQAARETIEWFNARPQDRKYAAWVIERHFQYVEMLVTVAGKCDGPPDPAFWT